MPVPLLSTFHWNHFLQSFVFCNQSFVFSEVGGGRRGLEEQWVRFVFLIGGRRGLEQLGASGVQERSSPPRCCCNDSLDIVDYVPWLP